MQYGGTTAVGQRTVSPGEFVMSNLTERRRIIFRHVDGEFYAVSRNGGSKHPGYLYLPQGASQTDENIIGTEDLDELARAALDEHCAVRCKNLTTGAQHYLRFNENELCCRASTTLSARDNHLGRFSGR